MRVEETTNRVGQERTDGCYSQTNHAHLHAPFVFIAYAPFDVKNTVTQSPTPSLCSLARILTHPSIEQDRRYRFEAIHK
jgi:hypothetical protein